MFTENIVNNKGKFKSIKEIKNEFNINFNFLELAQLLASVAKEWLDTIKT